MGVEIIHDEVPLHDVRISAHGALNMSEKILLIPGRPSRDLSDRALRDMEVDDQGQRAMPEVLKLPAQHAPRLHGQVGVLRFQGLHPVISSGLTVASPRSARA